MRIVLFTILFMLIPRLHAQNADLTSIFNENQGDELTVVLAINSNDCINCYYSGAQLVSQLPTNNIYVIFDNLLNRNYDDFLTSKLGIQLNRDRCTTDPELFASLTHSYGNTSGILVLRGNEILYNNSLKTNTEEVLKLFQPQAGLQHIISIDISNLSGSKQADAQIINDSLLLYFNDVRGDVHIIERTSGKKVNKLHIPVSKEHYNEWLTIAGLEAEDTLFVQNNPEELNYMDAFPSRVAMGIPFVGNEFIFVPIQILGMDFVLKENGDTSTLMKWFSFLCKYDFNGVYHQKWAFPYQVPLYKNHFNHLNNMVVVNDSILWMRASTSNRDSLTLIYRLPQNTELPVLLGVPEFDYPDRFPLKKGPYQKVYYSEFIDRDKYFFNVEPIIYSLSDSGSTLLEGWNFIPVEGDGNAPFWLSTIFAFRDRWYCIAMENMQTYCAVYDNNFQLLNKHLVLEKPLFDAHFDGKYVGGMSSDDEAILWHEFLVK